MIRPSSRSFLFHGAVVVVDFYVAGTEMQEFRDVNAKQNGTFEIRHF